MKRIIALFIAVLCVFSTLAPSVSAAPPEKGTSAKSVICSGSGYKKGNTIAINGQTMVEKYVTVKKGKTLQIKPSVGYSTGWSNEAKYVRFTVWIYDINSGERVKNVVCANGGFITWKNTGKKTAHLSVQVRPYIAQSAFRTYSADHINDFMEISNYSFRWNSNYKK